MYFVNFAEPKTPTYIVQLLLLKNPPTVHGAFEIKCSHL